ncbi:MAG: protein kinase [Thermoguttaceae bacterium]|nr:protein kinase [Thermoguttaceae bacterium]
MTARNVQCPRCHATIRLDTEMDDGKISCPECHKSLIVTVTHRSSRRTDRKEPDGKKTPKDETSGGKTTIVTASASQSTVDLRPPVDDSDQRIATVTRQMGLGDAERDRAEEDEFRIWKPGDLLLGKKYKVLELAPGVPYAEGGVGMVHRVHHQEWDIDFAVKSPKPAFVLSENGKQSFERECKTWMDLGLHTNVVTCYFFRRISGIPRVFAEYVADGTLKDWVADGRLYQGTKEEILERILDIAIQFAWGLDHAHSKGLLHLDVKPGNVMMSGSTAKVTDFGLAKAIGEGRELSDDSSPSCEGMTPSYCSPEQYEAFSRFQEETKTNVSGNASSTGREGGSRPITVSQPPEITKQSDIWSWAISILTMFHGRSPCKKGGQTAAQVFEIFLKTPPSEKRPAIPAPMVELLRHCFQKDPADRPQSMGMVADRLTEIYREVFDRPYPRTKPADTASNAESLSNRAISMLDLGKTREAVTDIHKAVSMCSWHPQITFNSTMIDWRFGLISDIQALDRMEELTKHNASDPYSHYALGLLQRERANPRGALQSLEKAVELDPKRPEFIKARDRCKKVSAGDLRCTGRFILWTAPEEDSPAVYADASEQLYIVPTAQNQMRLVSAATGDVLAEFKTANFASDDEEKLLAISTDYRRDIVRKDGRTVILRYKGGDNPPSLKPEDAKLLASLADDEPFRRINWGKKQDAHNQEGTLRLSIIGDTVCQFDTATGERTLTMAGHKNDVTALYVTPDGEWSATGSFDSSFKIWRVRSGRCQRTCKGLSGAVNAIWIDSKHRFLLTQVQGNSLQVWSIDLLCNHTSKIVAPLMICMVSSSEEVSQRQNEMETRIAEMKTAVAEKRYADAVAAFKKARKIDGWQNIRGSLNLPTLLGTRSAVTALDDAVPAAMFQAHEDSISTVALSYDGKLAISSGKDQVIRLWRFPQGELVSEMTAHYDWVRSVDMTIDGHFAISGSWDKTIRVWDLTTGKMVRKMAEPVKNVTQVRIAPDSATVASASGWGEIALWNAKTGEKINSTSAGDENLLSLQFSRDGAYILSGGARRITLWNARDLSPLRHFEGFGNDVTASALSPDRKWGAGADAEGEILLFDMEAEGKQTPKSLEGHLGGVSSLLFLPDGRRLVSAGKDGTIRLWNIPSGKLERTLAGKTAGANCLAVNITQSALVSGGDDAILRMWNLYWNYEYPGPRPAQEDVLRMLRVIVEHQKRMTSRPNERKSTAEFYTPGKNTAMMRFSPDDKTIIRILNEMSFRGFGNIPRGEILSLLRSMMD